MVCPSRKAGSGIYKQIGRHQSLRDSHFPLWAKFTDNSRIPAAVNNFILPPHSLFPEYLATCNRLTKVVNIGFFRYHRIRIAMLEWYESCPGNSTRHKPEILLASLPESLICLKDQTFPAGILSIREISSTRQCGALQITRFLVKVGGIPL